MIWLFAGVSARARLVGVGRRRCLRGRGSSIFMCIRVRAMMLTLALMLPGFTVRLRSSWMRISRFGWRRGGCGGRTDRLDVVDCNGGFYDGCMNLEDMIERTFDSSLSLGLQCRLFLYRFLASRFSLLFSTGFQVGRHHGFLSQYRCSYVVQQYFIQGINFFWRQSHVAPIHTFEAIILSEQDHLSFESLIINIYLGNVRDGAQNGR